MPSLHTIISLAFQSRDRSLYPVTVCFACYVLTHNCISTYRQCAFPLLSTQNIINHINTELKKPIPSACPIPIHKVMLCTSIAIVLVGGYCCMSSIVGSIIFLVFCPLVSLAHIPHSVGHSCFAHQLPHCFRSLLAVPFRPPCAHKSSCCSLCTRFFLVTIHALFSWRHVFGTTLLLPFLPYVTTAHSRSFTRKSHRLLDLRHISLQ